MNRETTPSEATATAVARSQIQTLAAEAAGWFETARRATGDTATGPREDGDEYVRTRDGEPDWIRDLVYAAHGGDDGMLPDDWRYKCIRAALDWIAENDADPDDAGGDFADSHVDVYTSKLFAWAASHGDRLGYADEAAQEMFPGGYSDGEYGRGGGEPVTVAMMLAAGQYAEAREVFETVLRTLGERVAP